MLSIFRIALVLTACILWPLTSQTAEAPQEYRVKAGYLLNIPMFAELPSVSSTSASFTICLLGESPLNDVLETMKGKRIKNRPVIIQVVQEITQVSQCQVLFIAASERYRLQRLLPDAHRRGIMTVSDMRDFAKLGGMVALVSVNGKIGYDLNLSAARAASVSFSTQLLKLANDVLN